MTDPGPCTRLLRGVSPPARTGLLPGAGPDVHVFRTEHYGLQLTDARRGEVQLCSLQRRLARTLELDARPLVQARPLERRLVGNSRDFPLLLVSILRLQGIPARARCGFAAYFLPGRFEDHGVVEVWMADRKAWVLVDSPLDGLRRSALKVSFGIRCAA
jgi:hypothetical protein